MNQDQEHLKLLVIFQRVLAMLAALFSLFPIIPLIVGLSIVNGDFIYEDRMKDAPFPVAAVGWFFIAFSACFILAGLSVAACIALSARYLSQRRNRLFSLVMGGVMCMFFPFGTALGVSTIVVLMRDSVKQLFEGEAPGAAQSPPADPHGARGCL